LKTRLPHAARKLPWDSGFSDRLVEALKQRVGAIPEFPPYQDLNSCLQHFTFFIRVRNFRKKVVLKILCRDLRLSVLVRGSAVDLNRTGGKGLKSLETISMVVLLPQPTGQ